MCIYYISQDDESVYKLHPVNGVPVKIATLPQKPNETEPFLLFLTNEEDPTQANLVERFYSFLEWHKNIPIISRIAETNNVLLTQFTDRYKDWMYGDCNFNIGRPLGKARESNHCFKKEYYAEFGVVLLKRREGDLSRHHNQSEKDAYGFAWQDWEKERRLFALGSPVGMWWIRNIIQFENDTILFELPNHQICLFDYHTNRIALLARGYGATAAIE